MMPSAAGVRLGSAANQVHIAARIEARIDAFGAAYTTAYGRRTGCAGVSARRARIAAARLRL